MDINKFYKEFTSFVFQDLSWLPLYKKEDGAFIKNLDNNAEKYIKDSLKIFSLKELDLKKKKIFNIGTGRESRFFAEKGADVTHLDITKESVKEITQWAKKKNLKIKSIYGDILDVDIGEKKYD